MQRKETTMKTKMFLIAAFTLIALAVPHKAECG